MTRSPLEPQEIGAMTFQAIAISTIIAIDTAAARTGDNS
jgi:hypothetical protein